ncbi:hypothetical protein [Streptomyces qinzhouensis]|uniref:Uncharacterized protein n=1 Tax=Streptomyces qinzhouensis TaxID=2599401 RepID=A0A5B8IH86_9ACTN|nr:hypothetical protein [Streptomyces qinzhouensis]QDY77612.1 hypothetical protein FQU76_14965 [Streptomyces qinzhouensis]
MRNLIHRVLNRLRAFLNPPTLVVVLVPAPVRTDPWARPWTSPDKEQAQAILQTRARRRVVVAPYGIRLAQPVAVRASRPGHAWTWVG